LNDRIRHSIRMLFVFVTALSNSPFELNTTTLLHDVRGFMRRGVQTRRTGEGNV
jgi:hypothetical protein